MNNKLVGLVALHSDKFPILGEAHGVCAISGYLKNKFSDIEIQIYDLQIDTIDQFLIFIKEEKPGLIGISVKLYTFNQLKILYKLIKHTFSKEYQPTIVLGNAIPNFNGRFILENYFDDIIIAVGEGEISMEGLYNYVNGLICLNQVQNIYYKESDKIIESNKVYLDSELIALPDRRNTKRFVDLGCEIYVEGSRGCSYGNCSICSCNEFLGAKSKIDKWRPRPIKSIISDLKNLEESGFQNVTFADEDFYGFNEVGIKRIQILCDNIINAGIKIKFRMNARIKSIFSIHDNEQIREEKIRVLKSLKEAGLAKIFIGLESGVETQLARYQKGFKLIEFNKAIEIIKQNQIDFEYGIILIDPLMTFNELIQSLNYIEQNNYIFDIASIYKELRVQVDNSYVKKIKKREEELDKKILGKFDFNSQSYQIKEYADEDVDFYVKHSGKWVAIIYKLYYLLRIFTRYDEQRYNSYNKIEIARSIFFITIRKIRNIEFLFLKDFANRIQNQGKKNIDIVGILKEYELQRQTIIIEFLDYIENRNTNEIVEIIKESKKYLKNSIDYLNELSNPN